MGWSKKVVTKYLDTYAEPEIRYLPAIEKTYHQCLVIPAYDESWENLQCVWQSIDTDFLLILVLNSPSINATLTNALLNQLKRPTTAGAQDTRCHFITSGDHPDMLLVDRCSPGFCIPVKQGVGLARKIGADIALKLIHQQTIHSRKISITDADAILPSNYFSEEPGKRDAALIFPFEHRVDNALSKEGMAGILYEIGILYYARSLKWSNSKYGYTSLGSTMVVSADHYAKVRGFPKRNAAEDFYLLNKLAKTGTIRSVNQEPITLSARQSHRVPFGTGPGINNILEMKQPINDYLYYHPRIFALLREFLGLLDHIWEEPDAMSSADKAIQQYFKESHFDDFVSAQRVRQKDRPVFEKQLTDWFDGFRTLKFVHFMRDNFFPSVPLSGLQEADFIAQQSPDDLTGLVQQLRNQLFTTSLST